MSMCIVLSNEFTTQESQLFSRNLRKTYPLFATQIMPLPCNKTESYFWQDV